MRRILAFVAAMSLGATALEASSGRRASLRGSAASMNEQNGVAKQHGLPFYQTPAQIRKAVDGGELVRLTGNDDYDVADFVNLPYAVPAARVFVERLSEQYRAACGQKLVVTSAVRAVSRQPRNAHALSVHPAGMALDIRVSDRASCRQWLESTILHLEGQGVINGIREFHPPHYHIAVYPEPYMAYVDARIAEEDALETAAGVAELRSAAPGWEVGRDSGGNAGVSPGVEGHAGGEPTRSSAPWGLIPLSMAALFVTGWVTASEKVWGQVRRTRR